MLNKFRTVVFKFSSFVGNPVKFIYPPVSQEMLKNENINFEEYVRYKTFLAG